MTSHKTKILVVDDEAIIRMNMTSDLMDAGFDVVEAWNADQAIVILEQDPEIDAVFSDIQMPGKLDGVDLARLIAERWPEKSIVITSGRGGPKPEALSHGSRYVAKPYEPRQVVAAFIAMLETRSSKL